MASQDVSTIKDDGSKQEDETHTLTRLISMGSMERDKPGVKGQDNFYCNKHFSMRALQGTGAEKKKLLLLHTKSESSAGADAAGAVTLWPVH